MKELQALPTVHSLNLITNSKVTPGKLETKQNQH